MKCHDARALANKENAKKSTGPRTEEGKARSRANAYKHGLAGSLVAFPGEQEGEMREFVAQQVAAEPLPPADAKASFLLERVAQISWQVDRAERAEEAQAVVRAAEAEGVVRRRREAEVAELVGLIETEPTRAMQELLASRTGLRWVVDSLKEMIDAVDADWWLCSLDERLDAICAPAQPGRLRISRAKALALAIGSGLHEAVWPNGVPGLEELEHNAPIEAYREWSRRKAAIVREAMPRWRAELRGLLARRLAEVERRLAELEARPDPALEYAALASTFDVSESAERLRRYVRSRERERRKLVEELERHRLNREANPNEAEPAEEPAPAPAAVAEAAPPLTPFDPPADATLNDGGYGLNTPDLTTKWVRSGDPAGGPRPAAPDRQAPEATPRE